MIAWEYIMIHHSLTKDGETVSWKAIEDFHRNQYGWADIGYHFGVELIGDRHQVLIGRTLLKPGAHCKESRMNEKAIGICCVGNFDLTIPSDQMMEILIHKLIHPRMDLFAIDKDHIVFHREYATYKSCPGLLFDKKLLLNRI